MIDPRTPAALAADALFGPAMRVVRELALTAGVEGVRITARVGFAHVEARRAGQWSGALGDTLAEAAETLATSLGRADLAEWLRAERDRLRRAPTIPAPCEPEEHAP